MNEMDSIPKIRKLTKDHCCLIRKMENREPKKIVIGYENGQLVSSQMIQYSTNMRKIYFCTNETLLNGDEHRYEHHKMGKTYFLTNQPVP